MLSKIIDSLDICRHKKTKSLLRDEVLSWATTGLLYQSFSLNQCFIAKLKSPPCTTVRQEYRDTHKTPDNMRERKVKVETTPITLEDKQCGILARITIDRDWLGCHRT